jgi:hypothetical protein
MEGGRSMKYQTFRRTLHHLSLITVLFASGQVHASDQWPFPCETHPRFFVYAKYEMQKISVDPKFNKEKGLESETLTQKEIVSNSDSDQYPEVDEHYDYWPPQ